MPSPQRGGVFMKLAREREAKAEERKRQRIAAGLPGDEPGGLTPEQVDETRRDIAIYNRQVAAALTKNGLDDAARFVERMARTNTEEQRDEAIDEMSRFRRLKSTPLTDEGKTVDMDILEQMKLAQVATRLLVAELKAVGLDDCGIASTLCAAAGVLWRNALPVEADRRKVITHIAEGAITGRAQPI